MSTQTILPMTRIQFSKANGIFLIILVLSVWVCLRSLRYYLPTVPFPAPLMNVKFHYDLILLHGTTGAIALFIGIWQFLAPLRNRYPNVHRIAGRIYVVMACLSAMVAIALSLHATTGFVAGAGFMFLGLAWFGTTAYSFMAILRRDVASHQIWMLRSYTLIFSAITLRVYVPLFHALHIPFLIAYPTIAWICWIPNLLIAEFMIQRWGKNREQQQYAQ
jgi:hypothetical protein